MNVYPFIEAEQAGKHSVKRACELLEVSRSGYDQHTRGGQTLSSVGQFRSRGRVR